MIQLPSQRQARAWPHRAQGVCPQWGGHLLSVAIADCTYRCTPEPFSVLSYNGALAFYPW